MRIRPGGEWNLGSWIIVDEDPRYIGIEVRVRRIRRTNVQLAKQIGIS